VTGVQTCALPISSQSVHDIKLPFIYLLEILTLSKT
jgi:hypothetical protein